jgi:hypothetical protein
MEVVMSKTTFDPNELFGKDFPTDSDSPDYEYCTSKAIELLNSDWQLYRTPESDMYQDADGEDIGGYTQTAMMMVVWRLRHLDPEYKAMVKRVADEEADAAYKVRSQIWRTRLAATRCPNREAGQAHEMTSSRNDTEYCKHCGGVMLDLIAISV